MITEIVPSPARSVAKVGLGAAAAAAVLLPLVLAIQAGTYCGSWFADSLTGWGMWGIFVIYLATRPASYEALAVLCLVAISRTLHLAIVKHACPDSTVINFGAYFPFFCLPLLGYRALRRPDNSRYRLAFHGALWFCYVGLFWVLCVSLANAVRPYKLDYLLYAFDGSLGPRLNLMIAEIAARSPALNTILNLTYDSLGFFVAVLFAMYVRFENSRLDILKLNIANALIGFFIYFLYPALGPKYAFPSFPRLAGSVPFVPVLLQGRPNAMPSLHVATALLLFLLARPWKWLRLMTGALLLMMVLAIFSTGEHYEIDAVVAVPYSLLILAFASVSRIRRYVLITTSAMLVLWLLVLRFGAVNPWIMRGMVLTTIAEGIVIERRLRTVGVV